MYASFYFGHRVSLMIPGADFFLSYLHAQSAAAPSPCALSSSLQQSDKEPSPWLAFSARWDNFLA